MTDFTFWNSVAGNEEFLAADRQHPARAKAAAIIEAEARAFHGVGVGKFRVCEVGPGPGFDYADHFAPLVKAGLIEYRGIEGSPGMVDVLRARFPDAEWCLGGFEVLKPVEAVYTKATLEHQDDFRGGLDAMLAAAPVVVVNFFLPPGPEESIVFNEGIGVHNNRYAAGDVRAFVAARGATVSEVVRMSAPGVNDNELWILRRVGV